MISSRIESSNLKKSDYTNSDSDAIVIGVFLNEKPNLADLSADIVDAAKNAINIESFKGKVKDKVLVYSKGKSKRLLLWGLGDRKKISNDNMRSAGANIYSYSNSLSLPSISLILNTFTLEKNDHCQSLLEGILIGSYRFQGHGNSHDVTVKKTKKILLLTDGMDTKKTNTSINNAVAIAEGVSVARDLGNEPANLCTPTYLSNLSKDIAKSKNMKAKIFDVKEFEKMKLGSFYGVARGAKEPAKLIIVEYAGGKKGEKPIGLIGKGLTFDTGGISLKPPAKMDEMKFDMCGSATVIGIMKVVSMLQPKINIVFAIGSTENMPGSDAQRPGDIVTAHNGKTIEVLNTDAEGRLVLADVLSYVNDNYKPKCMIDFATLTGAVIVALGHRATGLMGNNETLISDIKQSSIATGEKVWELPLWDDYTEDIKSKYADIKNIGSGGAGTITAGAFLKEFVADTPWCHLDIAGTAWGVNPTGYNPKFGATGVAVRLIYNFVENKIK
tara:strand:+ start:63 stop:1562 length:1500 start_codon:yes stop_codon:yes gene_type:complete